ncbi:MAG: hypothetical protein JNJ99_01495, partial [Crocinitomicaceae bacterium]|nr:hypothetical protein [Crocinitomicaceae bacterium]
MRVFFVFVLILVLISCKKSENQKAQVNFNFQTTFNNYDYAFSDYFTNGDGIKLRIELLQFYIADVRFIDKKGKEIQAEDIALVKIDQSGSGVLCVKVPAGDYTSVKFGIGVPKEMNEADPSEYNETDHPLSTTQNTYWGMNAMYRFVMIDGKYDLTGDGTDDGSFSYHTGYNECYRENEFVMDFEFQRKKDYSYNVMIDLSKLFYVSGSIINIPVE